MFSGGVSSGSSSALRTNLGGTTRRYGSVPVVQRVPQFDKPQISIPGYTGYIPGKRSESACACARRAKKYFLSTKQFNLFYS